MRSNSNWTFIVLNLPIQENSKAQLNKKAVDQISTSRDRLINSRVEHWNAQEISTTLAGAIRTAVGRQIWSKIPRKTCVKKLVNKCGCLKHHVLLNRKPMHFLKHRSYTGVSTGVKYNSGCTILDAL